MTKSYVINMINLTVIIFILIYIFIIISLGLLIYSYIDYLKISKEIDKALEEADKVIEDDNADIWKCSLLGFQ